MRRNLKRSLALLTVVALLFLAVPLSSFAESKKSVEDWDTYVQNHQSEYETAKSKEWEKRFADLQKSTGSRTLFAGAVSKNAVSNDSSDIDDTKRYVVLSIDVSGSMGGTPISAMKVASLRFCQQVLSSTSNTYLAISTYSSSATKICGFTRDITSLSSAISKLSAYGGTNHYASLSVCDDMLKSVEDSDASKDIVIMSDGLPQTGQWDSSGAYTYSDYYYYGNANAALKYAQKLFSGYTIFSLGFFHNLSGNDLVFARKYMKDLANGGYWEVTDPEKLEFTFGDIAEHIVSAKKGEFKFAGFLNDKHDVTATYYYSDSYFDGDSSDPNAHLATMSLCLELSSWTSFDFLSTSDNKTDWHGGAINICNLLEDIGFSGFSINECWYSKPEMHSIGAVAAHKNIKDYTVIALAVRGGGYFDEWGGNFVLGKEGNHEGFNKGRNKVINFLEQYISDNKAGFKHKVKLWIVGYSRGGAVANLVAGKLIDDGGIKGISLKNTDIFAYTFEAPQGYVANSPADAKKREYSVIHNYVNSMDIVPYVAPTFWKFQRYNKKDIALIPNLGTKDYQSTIERICKQYAIVLDGVPYEDSKMEIAKKKGKEFDTSYKPDPHAMKIDFGIDPTIRAGLFQKVKFGFLDLYAFRPYIDIDINPHWKSRNMDLQIDEMLMGSMTAVFGNLPGQRPGFVDKVEKPLSNLIKFFLGYNNKINWLEVIGDALFSNYAEGARKIVGILINPFTTDIEKVKDAAWTAAELIINSALKQTGTNLNEVKTALVDLLQAVFGAVLEDPQQFFGFLYYLIEDNGFQPHWPEITLAAMMSRDSYYTDNTTFNTDYPQSYRIIMIDCPVDVEVYETDGGLLSQIKGETVTNKSKVHGAAITDDGTKKIILPSDAAYDIRINATGSGQMSVSVLEYNSVLQQYTLLKGYQKIDIESGDAYKLVIPELIEADYDDQEADGSTSPYRLIGPDGADITPTVQLTGDNVTYQYVTLSSNNQKGIVTGGGQFIKSSFAQVQAAGLPSVEFLGWYQNGKCVSKDNVYRFPVNEDVELVAHFSEGSFHKLTATATIGGHVSFSEMELPATVEVELQAVPDDGYKFVRWEATSGKFEDSGKSSTVFTMPSNNAAIKAIFSNDRIAISHQPEDQYVVVGQRATFKVIAEGNDLHYQWYINRNGGKGWVPIDGAIGSEYITAQVTLANDGYQYFCRITDADGITVDSDIAVLHVRMPSGIPETGDTSRPMVWLMMLIIGAFGLFIAKRRLRHNR